MGLSPLKFFNGFSQCISQTQQKQRYLFSGFSLSLRRLPKTLSVEENDDGRISLLRLHPFLTMASACCNRFMNRSSVSSLRSAIRSALHKSPVGTGTPPSASSAGFRIPSKPAASPRFSFSRYAHNQSTHSVTNLLQFLHFFDF